MVQISHAPDPYPKPAQLKELFAKKLIWLAEKDGAQEQIIDRLFGIDSLPTGISSTTPRPRMPFKVDQIDCELADRNCEHSGLECGAVHEFFYPAHAPCALMAILAANYLNADDPHRLIVWIGQDCRPTPFILKSIDALLLKRSIFVSPPDTKLLFWSIENALRSRAAPVVIAALTNLSISICRRFVLAAERSGSVALLLRPAKFMHAADSAKTRWLIKPVPADSLNPRFNLKLLRQKGRAAGTSEWEIEIQRDGEGNEAISLCTPAESAPQKRRGVA